MLRERSARALPLVRASYSLEDLARGVIRVAGCGGLYRGESQEGDEEGWEEHDGMT